MNNPARAPLITNDNSKPRDNCQSGDGFYKWNEVSWSSRVPENHQQTWGPRPRAAFPRCSPSIIIVARTAVKDQSHARHGAPTRPATSYEQVVVPDPRDVSGYRTGRCDARATSQADRFRDELRSCETDTARYALCVQKRDELLDRQTGLQLLADTCELIMSAECPTYRRRKQARGRRSSEEDDAVQWRRFLGLAREGGDMKSSFLSALKEVARCWDRHIIQHYQWASRGEKYCNQLRAAARKVPRWDDTVSGLNWSILQRSRKVGQRPVRASANPIEQHDLERLKTWSQDPSRHEELPIDDVPNGLGFDCFSLLVH